MPSPIVRLHVDIDVLAHNSACFVHQLLANRHARSVSLGRTPEMPSATRMTVLADTAALNLLVIIH